jgi:hypothetical protein
MSTSNSTYQSLIDRITAYRKSASDANAVAKQDDVQQVSNPTVPEDPEAKKKKQGMPADQGNAEHMHGKAEGVDQSEATPESPKNVAADNDNVSKMANNISAIASRAAALLQNAQQQPEISKQANVDEIIELSPEFHFKLASAILETEEGIKMAESLLMRHKGQMEAQELIKNAMVAHHEFVKAAAAEQQQQAYEEAVKSAMAEEQAVKLAAIQEIAKNTSPEEQALIVKVASAHDAATSTLQDEAEKHAYAAGASDAEGMMQSEEGGQEMGESEGPASLEELLQVLSMLVESGEIDEQTAQQVAQQLMASEGAHEAGESGGEESMEKEGANAAKSASALLKHFGA